MNNLFLLLRRSKAGCLIDDFYAGVFGYADDLLLLCPSRDGLQKMLDIAEKYACDHKIAFSTDVNPTKSKTKGIIFSNHELESLPVPVQLNGNHLPWVNSGKYLGNKMTGIQDGYQKDTSEKRAQFIGRNIELNQEFHFAHPVLKSRINQIYNSSFYGSMLWNLRGEKTKQLINSWSVSVREMWDLPRSTHRIFIEPLGGLHAQTLIYSRYIGFIQSIRRCNKRAVIYLLEKVLGDLTTMTGQNVRHLLDEAEEFDIFKINKSEFKRTFKFQEMSAEEEWKINLVKELRDISQNVLSLDDIDGQPAFTQAELNEIRDYVATC